MQQSVQGSLKSTTRTLKPRKAVNDAFWEERRLCRVIGVQHPQPCSSYGESPCRQNCAPDFR